MIIAIITTTDIVMPPFLNRVFMAVTLSIVVYQVCDVRNAIQKKESVE